MINWRLAKVIAYISIALTVCAILNLLGIHLGEKAFSLISWNLLVVASQGYLVWFIYKMIH